MSMTSVLIWLGVTVMVSVLDYTIPARFTKLAGGTKAGSTGATIGMILGMFLTPIGMIPCSLLGAFLAEWLQENKSIGGALKSAVGTFIGFMLGSGLKIIASGTMLFYILF